MSVRSLGAIGGDLGKIWVPLGPRANGNNLDYVSSYRRFISEDERVNRLRKTFAGLYTLDEVRNSTRVWKTKVALYLKH